MVTETPNRLLGLVLVSFPLREGSIPVVQPDDPAGEPPLDCPAQTRAPAPAIGIATTLAVPRVVNSLDKTSDHKVSLRLALTVDFIPTTDQLDWMAEQLQAQFPDLTVCVELRDGTLYVEAVPA